MTNWPYTRDIPAGPNDPSVDRPQMTQNYNSMDSLIAEDHYGFNVPNGGFHYRVRKPKLDAIPGGTQANSTTQYAKLVNSIPQDFVTNGTTGNEYQMTRMDPVNFGSFGVCPAFVYADGQSGTAGWTFLPGGLSGGLRLQYGTYNIPNSFNTVLVTFPIAFTTCFVVTPVLMSLSATQRTWRLDTFGPTTFQFNVSPTFSGGTGYISWMAIGI